MWLTLTFLLSTLCFLCRLLITSSREARSPPLPPGPPGLPIIGSMLQVGSHPHRSLLELSKVYGPIMHLRVGSVPTIAVSSPELAELFLKTHDVPFANRPPSELTRIVNYGLRSFAFTEYGPRWRAMRKLCTANLLSASKVNSFCQIRSEEVALLVESLKEAARAHSVVNIRQVLNDVAANIMLRTVIGRRWDGREDVDPAVKKFRRSMTEFFKLAGEFNVNDFIPIAGFFDLSGMRKRSKALHEDFDEFLEKVINEHLTSGKKEEGDADFADILLGLSESRQVVDGVDMDRDTVKGVLLEMLVASLDTLRTSIEWIFSELLVNPRIMKKLQEEMAAAVGERCDVQESDLPKLEYLAMVIKEALRIHPLAGLLFHHGRQGYEINGFRIPKGANVLVNVWAIGRDPSVWPNPEEFVPERFEGSKIDVRGHDFELLPFGGGRRVCAGMNIALVVVPLIVAQMVHRFDWELAGGLSASDLDMTEVYHALTMPRATLLWAIPTQRDLN